MRFSLISSIICPALFACFSCQSQTVPTTYISDAATGKVVMLLSAKDASRAIITDSTYGFFNLITPAEMSVQMKKPVTPGTSRDSMLRDYLAFLAAEPIDFSAKNVEFIRRVITEMYSTVAAVNTGILPDTMRLIRSRENHYGQGVWYTRENCIIIPDGELADENIKAFTTTMFHELFHVYSRLNPGKSRELYKCIGFEPIGLDNLVLPEKLSERVLYNPDGVDYAQKIELRQSDNSTITAIPVIWSNNYGYTQSKKRFFDYVEFNLYPVSKDDTGKWLVKVEPDGLSSPLNIRDQPDFFRQIRENTGYIIHPDEVLADNFAFIMRETKGEDIRKNLKPEGISLLEEIRRIIGR
jgi:hypothetical protein